MAAPGLPRRTTAATTAVSAHEALGHRQVPEIVPHTSRRQPSVTDIFVPPPFREYFTRPQQTRHSASSPSPTSATRRRPVPPAASGQRFTSADWTQQPSRPDSRRNASRSASVDSPLGQPKVFVNSLSPISSAAFGEFQPRDLDQYPRGTTPKIPNVQWTFATPPAASEEHRTHLAPDSLLRPEERPGTSRTASDVSYYTAQSDTRGGAEAESDYGDDTLLTPRMSLHNGVDGEVATPPKSPGWFAWKSKDRPLASPATTYSDAAASPVAGPNLNKPLPGFLSAGPRPQGNRSASTPLSVDVPKANGAATSSYYTIPGTPATITANAAQEQIEELQRELREVSSELANSIRREMELEDELERMKLDVSTNSASTDAGKRTSDYYSDSGASSVRFPIGDNEQKLEELERIRRKVEQDKANQKVEMGQRLQTEMLRRREIETQLTQIHQRNISDAGEKQRELETSLQHAQRKLAEERQSKENYEDLLNAMRGELEGLRNERDNLRDEVVPALKVRVEGLEADATNRQSQVYDQAKLQHELDKLKHEKDSVGSLGFLRSARNRSNTVARNGSVKGGLNRAGSVKDAQSPDSAQSMADRVKDAEDQRDALHQALKSLLSRQEMQQREHKKRARELEEERERILAVEPKRNTFHTEVAKLKDEMNSLRKRADDALEQKWRCEKGLSGLRMDLDRAQQETSSLRGLLKEHDIPVPATQALLQRSDSTTSLDKAYKELRTTHALSLARVLEMENESNFGPTSADAQRTIMLLKKSISDAEAERAAAQREAESYRLQARALQKNEVEHISKNQTLAQDLFASAARMDDLAAQVEKQLVANRALKDKLAEAVGRGEREQKISASRIVEMQGKLRELEDRVTVAQQHSEEVVATHEDEVRQLKETHHSQLQRLKSSVVSPGRFSFLQHPGTVGIGGLGGLTTPPGKSPRITGGKVAAAVAGFSMAEASKTEELEKRVRQLERALKDAESEMEEVVGRMNMAQIEVAELQAQRDHATMQTRRLQAQIEAERTKVKALMG